MSSIFTGTVYKIVCSLDENIIYIGSTFNQLRHRWQTHKCHYKSYLERKTRCVSIYPYFEKFGIENFKIMKIKDYECYRENKADSKHLHAYEQLWINKTKNCVNKFSAFRIPIVAKEKRKEYNQVNREKILEKTKEWRKANQEKISEYQKEWGKVNREKRTEYQKEYTKEWRKVNQEKISEYQKKRVKCDICDKDLARGSLSKHKKRIHST